MKLCVGKIKYSKIILDVILPPENTYGEIFFLKNLNLYLFILSFWTFEVSKTRASRLLAVAPPQSHCLSTPRWPDRGADPQQGFAAAPSLAASSASCRLCYGTWLGSMVVGILLYLRWGFNKKKNFKTPPKMATEPPLWPCSCDCRVGQCSRTQCLWWSGKNISQLALPN